MQLIEKGAMNVGDWVVLKDKAGEITCYKVQEIINPENTPGITKDEVILDKKKNYFFIPDIVTKNESWVKNWWVIKEKTDA